MHPFQAGQVADQHGADLRAQAIRRRRAAAALSARRHVPVRHRAGWALIHLGLRLAASSADA
jgi:hypothetical protein